MNWGQWTVALLSGGFLAAAAAETGQSDRVEVRVAKPAPAFTLAGLDGGRFSSTTLTGKAAVVTFWASGDRPSQRQLTELTKLAAQYGPERLTVVGIVVNASDPTALRAALGDGLVNFPVLFVDLPVIAGFGGLTAIPSTFVIDKNYNVIQQYTGFIEKATLATDLDAVMKQ